MLFTVIIPTCNRNALLSNCLNLLAPAAQTITSADYRVIVTDDSKDNLAKSLVRESYPWAEWVEGPKKGPAANRNNGAKQAHGDWFVFLDDDCLPERDILEKYRQLIDKNGAIEVFEGLVQRERRMKSPLEKAPGNSHTKGGYLLSCNFAIRKDTFYEINGFDENFKYPHMEDYDFRDRIIAKNKTMFFAREAKVVHPWRKIKNGWALGKYEEMTVYYNSKNNIPSNLVTFLKVIIGRYVFRIFGFLKRLHFSVDMFVAIKVMFQHLIVVILNFNKWKRKYAKQASQ